jgi:hypothetical protein
MNSLLDIVRQKIKDLKGYRDTDSPDKPHSLLKKDTDYSSSFDQGSYRWYVAKTQTEAARRQDERNWKLYEEQLKDFNDRKGIEEKQRAVEALRNHFVSFEKALLEKDAKTFNELHPDNVDNLPGANPYPTHHEPPPRPFEVKFEFKASTVTDENREVYVKLYVNNLDLRQLLTRKQVPSRLGW